MISELSEWASVGPLDLALVAFWFGLYSTVSWVKLAVPKSVNCNLAKKVEWDLRIVSSVHALVLLAGSALVYVELRGVDAREMVFGYSFWSHLFAQIFRSYLVYDLTMVVRFYPLLKDIGSVIHHAIFLSVVGYCYKYSFFKYPFIWLTAGELSTPFVNLRWHLAERGQQRGAAYVANGVLLAATFFLSRVVLYGWGLAGLYRIRGAWVGRDTPLGLYVVTAGLVAGYLLNLYWFRLIARGLLKLLARSTSGASKAS